MTRRLVLVGAGLANLHVLRGWCRRPVAGVELVLVSPAAESWYSGMVPGYLRGAWEPEMLRIDLAAMMRAVGGRLIAEPAEAVHAHERVVVAGGERIDYDACAINIGASAAGDDVPGVAEHAVTLRPMGRAAELRTRLDRLMASPRPVSVVVVGAGAAGVEVALALQHRIAAAGHRGTVTIADGSPTLLPGAAARLSDRAARLLADRAIGAALGARVTQVYAESVWLASGALLPADVTAWVTGAGPPPLARGTDLALDPAGFLRVDRTLRVVGADAVWAAGDCAVPDQGRPLPRSGAYAASQGPVLLRNLMAALDRGRPRRYRPRAHALSILDTSDGRGLLLWGPVHLRGRWAWRLKQWIDLRFMRAQRLRCDETPARGS